MIPISITPRDIYDYLDQRVVGQTAAKKAIAQVGFLHAAKRWHWIMNPQLKKPLKSSNALIMGPSGCGKTYLVSLLAEYLGTPFLEINARALTQEGYKGMNISEHFSTFIEEKQLGPGTIVFLDEFDKLCARKEEWEVGIQHMLLKLIEGGGVYVETNRVKRKIETHDMLFILGGNFKAIREQVRKPKPSIGFKPQHEEAPANLHRQLIKTGMIQELAGRISIITEVEELSRKQLREALLNPTSGPYVQYQELYEDVFNQTLELSQYQVNKILDLCEQRKIGARGLQSALDEYLQNDVFERGVLDEEHLMSQD